LKSLFVLELTRLKKKKEKKKKKVKVRRGSTTTCSLVPGNLVPDYWYTDQKSLGQKILKMTKKMTA
jgi:hypothetical protein